MGRYYRPSFLSLHLIQAHVSFSPHLHWLGFIFTLCCDSKLHSWAFSAHTCTDFYDGSVSVSV